MRIISGKYRGKKLILPKNFNARPTTDYAKESLFNILNTNFNFEKLNVLDLFSGSGSISYEFASRGCKSITAIEKNYKNYMVIKNHINLLDAKAIDVIKADAFKILKKLDKQFNIIFADPPYDLPGIDMIPDLVFNPNILLPNGWFILEHSKKHHFSSHQYFSQLKIYGEVHFSIFINKG